MIHILTSAIDMLVTKKVDVNVQMPLCLKQRDRPWAEDCDRRVGHPMNLVIYDSIHHSIEEIIAHVTRPPFDFIKSGRKR